MNRNLTSMELKEPHPSRLVGGMQTQNRLVPHPRVVDKNFRGDISGVRSPSPHRPTSLGFQCQEDKSPQLPAAKTSWNWVGGRNFWRPKQFLLKNPQQTHLFRLTPSQLQHRGSSLKGPVLYKEKLKCLASRRAEATVCFLNFTLTELAIWCHI